MTHKSLQYIIYYLGNESRKENHILISLYSHNNFHPTDLTAATYLLPPLLSFCMTLYSSTTSVLIVSCSSKGLRVGLALEDSVDPSCGGSIVWLGVSWVLGRWKNLNLNGGGEAVSDWRSLLKKAVPLLANGGVMVILSVGGEQGRKEEEDELLASLVGG